MSDELHDKVLSCDDLATKTLPQLEKMRAFYDIKINDLRKQSSFFKYQHWLSENKKTHSILLISSIVIFVISFYIALKITPFAAIVSVIAVIYILITGISINDVRSQAIMKNIATIEYMIQTFKEKDSERKISHVFRRKAQIVYECIRNSNNGRINNSDLLKAVRKFDSKLDKNTLNKILDNELIDVIIIENNSYSTGSRDLSNTRIFKIKNM